MSTADPQMELFEALTRSEKLTLRDCEHRIEQAANSEQDAGEALATIQENRLHRATAKTFEGYVKKRFGYGKTYAYRLIKSCRIRRHLAGLPHGDAVERVLRGIAESDMDSPEQFRAAWTLAIEKADGQAPTNAHVADAVREIAPPDAKKSKGPSSIPGVQLVTVEKIVKATHKAGKVVALQTINDEDEDIPISCVFVVVGTAAVRDMIAVAEEIEGREKQR